MNMSGLALRHASPVSQAMDDLEATCDPDMGTPVFHGGNESCLDDRVVEMRSVLSGGVQGHEPRTSLLRRAEKGQPRIAIRLGQPWIAIRLRYHAGVQADFQHVLQ